MTDSDGSKMEPDLRKEPNRRANRKPDYAGEERRKGDRRKSPRL